MTENISVKDVVFEKKTDGYGYNMNDFKAAQELTLEITLNEYRDLVTQVATKKDEIDRANADKYERENEIKRLKEQVESLKAENYELKKTCDRLMPNGNIALYTNLDTED